MRRWRVLSQSLVVLALVLIAGCGDDDGSAGTSTTTSAPGVSTSTTEATAPDSDSSTTSPGGSDTTAPDAGPVDEPVIDLVDGTLLGHQPGAEADVVIEDLIARLGEPQVDSGWGPTECPPVDSARSLGWPGFFVYFSDVDGRAFDGTRLHADAAGDLADAVVLPAGIEWGTPIEDVATNQGSVAEFSDAYGWWEVWVDAEAITRSYVSESDGPLDGVMLGYVPRCG